MPLQIIGNLGSIVGSFFSISSTASATDASIFRKKPQVVYIAHALIIATALKCVPCEFDPQMNFREKIHKNSIKILKNIISIYIIFLIYNFLRTIEVYEGPAGLEDPTLYFKLEKSKGGAIQDVDEVMDMERLLLFDKQEENDPFGLDHSCAYFQWFYELRLSMFHQFYHFGIWMDSTWLFVAMCAWFDFSAVAIF
ncbi:hypothetical protein ACJX0J_021606, partial [Zea mays]